jgi:hypothetical protein
LFSSLWKLTLGALLPRASIDVRRFTEGPLLMAVALLFQVFGPVLLLHGIMAGRKQPLNSDPHSIWKNKRIDYG